MEVETVVSMTGRVTAQERSDLEHSLARGTGCFNALVLAEHNADRDCANRFFHLIPHISPSHCVALSKSLSSESPTGADIELNDASVKMTYMTNR